MLIPQHSYTVSRSHRAFWTWLISSSLENSERDSSVLHPCICSHSHSLWWWKLNTTSSIFLQSCWRVESTRSYVHLFSQKVRDVGRLIIKNEFLLWLRLTHYSSWLFLAVWISFWVPELIHLSLSGVGPWQMCQYDCSVLGERHLNSPWCITLAATNLEELSSKSSHFSLLLTICFISLDKVNI